MKKMEESEKLLRKPSFRIHDNDLRAFKEVCQLIKVAPGQKVREMVIAWTKEMMKELSENI